MALIAVRKNWLSVKALGLEGHVTRVIVIILDQPLMT